jgi:hypothetical protein
LANVVSEQKLRAQEPRVVDVKPCPVVYDPGGACQ